MGMSLRVVDEHEIGREYTERSLKELYRFQDSDDEGLADDADKVRVQLAAAVEREGIDDAAVEAAEATVPLATSGDGDGDGDGDGSADEPSGAEVSIALSSDEDELGSQSDVSPGVEDWEFQIPEGRDRTRRSRARRKKALARMRSRKRRGRRRAGDDDDSDEGYVLCRKATGGPCDVAYRVVTRYYVAVVNKHTRAPTRTHARTHVLSAERLGSRRSWSGSWRR